MRLLISDLRSRWRHRQEYRALEASWTAWRARNPAAPFAAFYAAHKLTLLRSGAEHVAYGLGSPRRRVDSRTASFLRWLQSAGLRPGHTCVDYGCGSLWVGEALIDYLEPGRYIGLDVVEDFYVVGLERLSPQLVEKRRPELCVISERSLETVRARTPDFIFCGSVLLHVPPDDVEGFFETLISLASQRTRIVLSHEPGAWTRRLNAHTWRHSRRAIGDALRCLDRAPQISRLDAQTVMVEVVSA